MQSTFRFSRLLAATLLLTAFTLLAAVPTAQAATPNVAVGAGQVVVIPFHISGQYTASTTAVVKFDMPFPCTVLGVGATARASGGTTPTLTVDVLKGASPASILSAPISITAGTYSEGTIATAAIADETPVTVDLAIGGTSPTWNDITVLITVARE